MESGQVKVLSVEKRKLPVAAIVVGSVLGLGTLILGGLAISGKFSGDRKEVSKRDVGNRQNGPALSKPGMNDQVKDDQDASLLEVDFSKNSDNKENNNDAKYEDKNANNKVEKLGQDDKKTKDEETLQIQKEAEKNRKENEEGEAQRIQKETKEKEAAAEEERKQIKKKKEKEEAERRQKEDDARIQKEKEEQEKAEKLKNEKEAQEEAVRVQEAAKKAEEEAKKDVKTTSSDATIAAAPSIKLVVEVSDQDTVGRQEAQAVVDSIKLTMPPSKVAEYAQDRFPNGPRMLFSFIASMEAVIRETVQEAQKAFDTFIQTGVLPEEIKDEDAKRSSDGSGSEEVSETWLEKMKENLIFAKNELVIAISSKEAEPDTKSEEAKEALKTNTQKLTAAGVESRTRLNGKSPQDLHALLNTELNHLTVLTYEHCQLTLQYIYLALNEFDVDQAGSREMAQLTQLESSLNEMFNLKTAPPVVLPVKDRAEILSDLTEALKNVKEKDDRKDAIFSAKQSLEELLALEINLLERQAEQMTLSLDQKKEKIKHLQGREKALMKVSKELLNTFTESEKDAKATIKAACPASPDSVDPIAQIKTFYMHGVEKQWQEVRTIVQQHLEACLEDCKKELQELQAQSDALKNQWDKANLLKRKKQINNEYQSAIKTLPKA